MFRSALLTLALIVVAACPPTPERVDLVAPAFSKPRAAPRVGDCAAKLAVTEIMYDPRALADAEGEYIEFVNDSDADTEVTGWRLEINGHRSRPLGQGDGPTVQPGGVLVVAASEQVAVPPDAARLVVKRLGLANSHSRIRLLDPCGGVASDVSYGTEPPWPGPSPGRAIERCDTSSLPGDGAAWEHARAILPGGDRGSPGVVRRAVEGASGQKESGALISASPGAMQSR
jgi:hypothetical protein